MSDRKRDGSKLSFSDLDKLRRERKSGRQGDVRVERAADAGAQKSYRAALEKAFDSGRLAEFAATLQRSRDPVAQPRPRGKEPEVDERLVAQPTTTQAEPEAQAVSPPPRQPVDPERAERRKLAGKITDAEAADELVRAVDRYLERFQELPRDLDVLEKALSHPRSDVVRHALERIDVLVSKQKPRRSRSLSVQLSILEETHGDADVRALAAQIRAAL